MLALSQSSVLDLTCKAQRGTDLGRGFVAALWWIRRPAAVELLEEAVSFCFARRAGAAAVRDCPVLLEPLLTSG